MAMFKVGDVVTIRQWDDMEKEYGLIDGYIDCPYLFTENMKKFCGRKMKIERDYALFYTLEGGDTWSFTDGMFEESKTTKPKYWVVKSDECNHLFRKCIKYINEKAGVNWSGSVYGFYGFDGSDGFNGYDCMDMLDLFKNNPQLITLEEWYKWFGSEDENTIKEEQSVEDKEEQPVSSKFKVGDRVHVLPTSPWAPGEYGVIKKIDETGVSTLPYAIETDRGTQWHINPDHLVKCPPRLDVVGVSEMATTTPRASAYTFAPYIDNTEDRIKEAYQELVDVYTSVRTSNSTSMSSTAKEEPTSIFTFTKLK